MIVGNDSSSYSSCQATSGKQLFYTMENMLINNTLSIIGTTQVLKAKQLFFRVRYINIKLSIAITTQVLKSRDFPVCIEHIMLVTLFL